MFLTTSSIAYYGIAATIASGLSGTWTSLLYEFPPRCQKFWKIFFDHLVNTGHYTDWNTFVRTYDKEIRKKILADVAAANKNELVTAANLAVDETFKAMKRSFVICSAAAIIAVAVAAIVERRLKGSKEGDQYATEIGLEMGCAIFVVVIASTSPLLITITALFSLIFALCEKNDSAFSAITHGIFSGFVAAAVTSVPLGIAHAIKLYFIKNPFAK